MIMARTPTERKNEWNAKVYDRVTLIVKAGEKERIQKAAADAGMKMNRFILESINAAHPGLLSILDDTSRQKKEGRAVNGNEMECESQTEG